MSISKWNLHKTRLFKSYKYYEIAANKFNNSKALFELGVKRDFLKAREYYERLMKHELNLPGSLYGFSHIRFKDAYVKLANILLIKFLLLIIYLLINNCINGFGHFFSNSLISINS